jgi:molecular chaperone GrpE
MSKDQSQEPGVKSQEEQQADQTSSQVDLPSEDAQISNLKSQIEALTEGLQRERADAVNLRRRHDEQIASLKNVVKANIVRDLLPVIDNFERALKHVPTFSARHAELVSASPEQAKILKQVQDDVKKYDDYIKGVQGVVKQFEKTLADMGVERIKTIGEPFDPKYHEAVSMEDGDGAQEIVAEELQPGYKLGEDVVRPATVKVKMQ